MLLLCMKCKMQSPDNNAKVKKQTNKQTSKMLQSSHLLGGYFISFMFPDIEL